MRGFPCSQPHGRGWIGKQRGILAVQYLLKERRRIIGGIPYCSAVASSSLQQSEATQVGHVGKILVLAAKDRNSHAAMLRKLAGHTPIGRIIQYGWIAMRGARVAEVVRGCRGTIVADEHEGLFDPAAGRGIEK